MDAMSSSLSHEPLNEVVCVCTAAAPGMRGVVQGERSLSNKTVCPTPVPSISLHHLSSNEKR